MPRLERSAEDLAVMHELGITQLQAEFFSSAVVFYNHLTGLQESEMDRHFRGEVWNWLETSLSKGDFKWVG